ncbi:MAG: glycosyltransferase family 2 protein [Thermoleophilia bacterium]
MRALVVDHQGKSVGLQAALRAQGWEPVQRPELADVVLVDHDLPGHGRLPLVEACVAAGGRAFLYPHGAAANLMAGWDGHYPVSPLLSGALVPAAGHVAVAEAYGYPHPVHVVGWWLCPLRDRVSRPRVEHVLFAPTHPPWTLPVELEAFERLRALDVRVTVRHVGPVEECGLPIVDGVEYVEADIFDFGSMLAQIDAAHCVVADASTFATLAVARGVTTVMLRSDHTLDNTGAHEAAHADAYRGLLRFPFDAADGDLGEVIAAAAADVEEVAEWRARFVGEPLDAELLTAVLRDGPARGELGEGPGVARRLHARALASVEQGDGPLAEALLARAVTRSLDLEVLNDLAVVKAGLGHGDEAEALLRACLAVDGQRVDARENLAALAAPPVNGDGRPHGDGKAGWRTSATLGGPDAAKPERAYPGMGSAASMLEHTQRYALALGLVGGLDVLDLGCGTGYGSEMLTWTARHVRGFDLWQPADHERPAWPGGAELTYGHDLCVDPLPQAEAATMFEVIEHLAAGGALAGVARGAAADRVVPEPGGARLAPQPVPRERLVARRVRAARRRGRAGALAERRPDAPLAAERRPARPGAQPGGVLLDRDREGLVSRRVRTSVVVHAPAGAAPVVARLGRQLEQHDELVVVQEHDGPVELAEPAPGVRVLSLPGPTGLQAALNLGAAVARGLSLRLHEHVDAEPLVVPAEAFARVGGLDLLRPVGPGLAELRDRLAARDPEPGPEPAPRVTIVIPVHDRAELTAQCLQALARTCGSVPVEVIVADNASDDWTAELVDRYARWGLATRIANEENLGFGRACNQGVEAARGDHVLFLNNDTIPHPGWLEALVATLDADPGVGAVGARLLYPDGTIQHAGVVLDSEGVSHHVHRGLPADDPAVTEERDLPAVTGACLILPRALLRRLGGFDESYHMYVEDIDLCLRVWEAGLRVRYQPAAVVTHLENGSIADVGWRNEHVLYGRQVFVRRWAGRWPAGVRKLAWPVVLPGGPPHLAVVALADELVAEPRSAAAWAATFAGLPATLVVYAPDAAPSDVAARLVPALAEAGVGDESGVDLLLVAVPRTSRGEAELASSVVAAFGERSLDGPLAALPRIRPDARAELARLAARALPPLAA